MAGMQNNTITATPGKVKFSIRFCSACASALANQPDPRASNHVWRPILPPRRPETHPPSPEARSQYPHRTPKPASQSPGRGPAAGPSVLSSAAIPVT
jgi:hypothetical protein